MNVKCRKMLENKGCQQKNMYEEGMIFSMYKVHLHIRKKRLFQWKDGQMNEQMSGQFSEI